MTVAARTILGLMPVAAAGRLPMALAMMLATIMPVAQVLAQGGPANVEVDAVIEEPVSQTTPVLGQLVLDESIIASEVDGVVEQVFRVIGDSVERDEPLVALGAGRIAATLSLREAEMAEAQSAFDQTQAAFERAEVLRAGGNISEAALDDARDLRNQAQARLAAAETGLIIAQLDFEDSTISAPFAGIIAERHAFTGAYLRVGDPVVTLINDHRIEIEAPVPTNRVSGLVPGTQVPFTLADGSAYVAEVRAVIPQEDPQSRTRTVRLSTDFEDTQEGRLADNQSVTIDIPVGVERTAVTVHKDAVITGPRGQTVFVAVDGAAEMRPIQLGEPVGNRFEVVSGLSVGELVVVRGNERLFPGQPVQYDPQS